MNDFFPEQKNATRDEETNMNCDATTYSMIIYDRLGRVVYNSKGEQNKPWNGKEEKAMLIVKKEFIITKLSTI